MKNNQAAGNSGIRRPDTSHWRNTDGCPPYNRKGKKGDQCQESRRNSRHFGNIQRENLGSQTQETHTNDMVLIDIGRSHILDGNIYALRIGHTVMIKRLSLKIGGKIQVISDNRNEYESYEARAGEVHVLGQVIFYCRDLVKLN